MKLNSAKEIPIEELHRVFSYNPETGSLTWKINGGRKREGKEAGGLSVYGYRVVGIKCYRIPGHRVCYAHYHGYWPDDDIDHQNGVKTDNRVSNLRLASRSQNMANTLMRRDNTSGVKGVYWIKHLGKWRAAIKHNYKSIYFGYFFDKLTAEAAVRLKREEIFGEFANHG